MKLYTSSQRKLLNIFRQSLSPRRGNHFPLSCLKNKNKPTTNKQTKLQCYLVHEKKAFFFFFFRIVTMGKADKMYFVFFNSFISGTLDFRKTNTIRHRMRFHFMKTKTMEA